MLAVLAVAVLALSTAQVFTEQPYAKVGWWSVYPSDDVEKAFCLAASEFEDGTYVAFARTAPGFTFYSFSNAKWNSLRRVRGNVNIAVEFVWKGRVAETFTMSAKPDNDAETPGFHVKVENDDFGAAWSTAHSVILYYNGNKILHHQLQGTYAAGLKALECARTIQGIKDRTNRT